MRTKFSFGASMALFFMLASLFISSCDSDKSKEKDPVPIDNPGEGDFVLDGETIELKGMYYKKESDGSTSLYLVDDKFTYSSADKKLGGKGNLIQISMTSSKNAYTTLDNMPEGNYTYSSSGGILKFDGDIKMGYDFSSNQADKNYAISDGSFTVEKKGNDFQVVLNLIVDNKDCTGRYLGTAIDMKEEDNPNPDKKNQFVFQEETYPTDRIYVYDQKNSSRFELLISDNRIQLDDKFLTLKGTGDFINIVLESEGDMIKAGDYAYSTSLGKMKFKPEVKMNYDAEAGEGKIYTSRPGSFMKISYEGDFMLVDYEIVTSKGKLIGFQKSKIISRNQVSAGTGYIKYQGNKYPLEWGDLVNLEMAGQTSHVLRLATNSVKMGSSSFSGEGNLLYVSLTKNQEGQDIEGSYSSFTATAKLDFDFASNQGTSFVLTPGVGSVIVKSTGKKYTVDITGKYLQDDVSLHYEGTMIWNKVGN